MDIHIPAFFLVTLVGMIVSIVAAAVSGGIVDGIKHSSQPPLFVGIMIGAMIVTWRGVVALVAVTAAAYMQVSSGAPHPYLVTSAVGLVTGIAMMLTALGI